MGADTIRFPEMKWFDFHTHRLPAPGEFAIYNAALDEDVALLGCRCSVGVHPWFIDGSDVVQEIARVRERSGEPTVVAIGECGLDKLCVTDFEVQKRVFESMIEISEAARKPLLIHCVKAFDELNSIRKKIKPLQPWVIHGFRGNEFQGRQLLAKGFYFSIGEKFNAETIKVLPLNSFFVETDESMLSIESVYCSIAEIKQISMKELGAQIELNVKNILKIEL